MWGEKNTSQAAATTSICFATKNTFSNSIIILLFCVETHFLLRSCCCICSPTGKCDVIYDAIIIHWQIMWFIVFLFNQMQACIYNIGSYIRFKEWRKKSHPPPKKKPHPPTQCNVVNCVNLLHLFSITPVANGEGVGGGGRGGIKKQLISIEPKRTLWQQEHQEITRTAEFFTGENMNAIGCIRCTQSYFGGLEAMNIEHAESAYGNWFHIIATSQDTPPPLPPPPPPHRSNSLFQNR